MRLVKRAFPLIRPLLHRLDAEQAHLLTLTALKALPWAVPPASDPCLSQRLFGLDFPNPLGLAAGFDKNADVPDAMLGLGFGFVEVGTVTPRPQTGNPKPRLFRLSEDQAVINRMGFNNQGHGPVFKRLTHRRSNGIVGVNVGANKDSVDRLSDYVAGIVVFAELASYITINISSPNTPGLRGLQSADALHRLLERLNQIRRAQTKPVAMLLKIAPDLDDAELRDIAACCAGGAVDGVIISNTTLQRQGLTSRHRSETGGLSGRPLQGLANRQLAKFYGLSKGRIPLIGVGGIDDAASAMRRIQAGASLLQIYSALVYKGPGLVSAIIDGLGLLMQQKGYATLAAACGTEAGSYQMGPGK